MNLHRHTSSTPEYLICASEVLRDVFEPVGARTNYFHVAIPNIYSTRQSKTFYIRESGVLIVARYQSGESNMR